MCVMPIVLAASRDKLKNAPSAMQNAPVKATQRLSIKPPDPANPSASGGHHRSEPACYDEQQLGSYTSLDAIVQRSHSRLHDSAARQSGDEGHAHKETTRHDAFLNGAASGGGAGRE